jgi:signal transduction histidine kinase
VTRGASLLVLGCFLASLGVWIWRAQPRKSVHRWFGAYTLSMATWVLAIAGLQSLWWPNVASRLAFASASLIPASFLAFTRVYPGANAAWRTVPVYAALACGLALAVCAVISDLLVRDVVIVDGGLHRETGPLYRVFTAYFLVVWLAALATFVNNWRRARGLARVQLQHLGIGLLISGAGGITTNLLVPAFTGSSAYSGLGPYFLVPMVAVVAHAIVRHRLLDLRPVIHQGLALGIGIAISSYVAIALARSTGVITVEVPIAVLVIFGSVAVAFSAPVLPIVRRTIDQYLLTGQPDAERTLVDATSRLMRVMPRDKLAAEVVQILRSSVQAETITVIVGEAATSHWEVLHREHPSDDFDAMIGQAWRLVETLGAGVQLLEAGPKHRSLESLYASLRQTGVEIWFGIRRDAAAGVVLLGPRKLGRSYFAQQLSLLESLSPIVAAAVEIDILHRRHLALGRARERDAHLARTAHLYATLAHEIRTPLTTISNFVSMLPERLDDPEYRELLMRLVPAEVERIVALAERLRGLGPPDRTPGQRVNLTAILSDVVALQRAASQRHVQVVLENIEVAPIVGDAQALTQLFGNLLQNAIEASPDGGRVWIGLRGTELSVSVEIVDEGPGIPGSVRERAFEPFVTTKPHGLGLGLSICREIVEAHHAELHFEPGPEGVGTRAIVNFFHAEPVEGHEFKQVVGER